ncbi:MAG TPA: GntR family transcriptional regulator [Alphaproteobacteria bacterium]|nr:GntR family transcriptional regulator [Alphaproteobacteria bacterium]
MKSWAALQTPVRTKNLVNQLAADLRGRIYDGDFKAGERLNINALAKHYDVSATPVREALAMLSAENVVTFKENIGYRVAPAPTEEEFIQWAEARIAIESQAIMLAKGPVPEDVIKRLRRINETIAQGNSGTGVVEIAAFSDANWEFHAALVSLAKNTFLSRAHETLYRGRRFSQVFLGRGVVNRSDVVAEHATIIAALERGNLAVACESLRHHISASVLRDREFTSQESA